MRFLMIMKASKDSEAGKMPSEFGTREAQEPPKDGGPEMVGAMARE